LPIIKTKIETTDRRQAEDNGQNRDKDDPGFGFSRLCGYRCDLGSRAGRLYGSGLGSPAVPAELGFGWDEFSTLRAFLFGCHIDSCPSVFDVFLPALYQADLFLNLRRTAGRIGAIAGDYLRILSGQAVVCPSLQSLI
jgi:hypothetical protein